MYIENWLAAVLFAFFMILGLIPSICWCIESLRLEKAEKQNKRLIQENGDLRTEICRLKSLVVFHKAKNEDYE